VPFKPRDPAAEDRSSGSTLRNEGDKPRQDTAGDTDDRVTLRGRRDFAIYYLPASVPFWSALLLGLDIKALTWLIWLELLPRALLLCRELPRDKDYRGKPLSSVVAGLAVVLVGCVGTMAFVAMFFPEMGDAFAGFWEQRSREGLGAALGSLVDAWWRMGILLPLAVAVAARAWRAWWIDVRQDPSMAHVRCDTRERRTRRMFAFVALILWIALLSRFSALERFGPRFFASLAAFVYCFLPFVVAEGDKLRRKFTALREPV
jgi:hypothetical protein